MICLRVAVLLVSLLALFAPASAGAESDWQRLSTGRTPGEPATTYDVDGCFTDPTGDTRLADRTGPGASPQADVDLFCVNYDDTGIDLAVRIPHATDPATDPTWDNFNAGMAFSYRAADGGSREIQLSTQNNDDVLQFIVLEGSVFPTRVCSGAATFADTVYSAHIPGDCVDAPDTIELVAITKYGDCREDPDNRPCGFTDFAPFDGGTVAVPRSAPAGADRVNRLFGAGRVDTAIAISHASFDAGAADAALIALADDFPDAVVAAPLAVTENGPVLLTPGQSVPPRVLAEVDRLLAGPGRVVLLGGTAALGEQVRAAFEDAGHTVERIGGDSRFTTAVAIAEAANPDPAFILLAGGGDYPDALVAGAAAPTFDGVAVLVGTSSIPPQVQAYLDVHPNATTLAVGAVANGSAAAADIGVAGLNPGHTSALMMREYPRTLTEVTLATYERFPDGLAGGAYAAARGIPILLSARDGVSSAVLDQLNRDGPFSTITLMGGAGALSDTVAGQVAGFIG